jgi:hypothetical protein
MVLHLPFLSHPPRGPCVTCLAIVNQAQNTREMDPSQAPPGDDGFITSDAVALLSRYLTNILKNPDDAKYRRIRVGNERFAAAVWSSPAARSLLEAAGWETIEADDGMWTVLPADVAPDAMEILLSQAATAAQPSSPHVNGAAGAASASAAVAPGPNRSSATGSTRAEQEAHKKAAVLAKERAANEAQMRKLKADKLRIRKQLEADRQEAARRQLRDSHATERNFGSRINRFADVGVDLNKGGG